MRILYIEDDEDSAYMLRQRLQRRGYEIVLAINGKEGVALAQKERPDLIVMDLDMPVLNGWEAAKYLKSLSPTALIPIIALTSHAMAGQQEKVLAADFDDFDTKPVNFARLLAKIEALLTNDSSS